MKASPALSRRAFTAAVGTSLLAPLAAAGAPRASLPPPSSPPVAAGDHGVRPLPFDPARLKGLSEKLLTSHHDKNYAGAVKNLNRVEQALAALPADAPPFTVAALRDKELTFRNSQRLHEAYFDVLGGDGKQAGAVVGALAKAFGSAARWEAEFRAIGQGLAGGSGWVVLALELEGGALRLVSAGNHKEALAMAVPLLVMDMYEHSYAMDFGADAARYIDAFFVNLKWEAVNARYERAVRQVL